MRLFIDIAQFLTEGKAPIRVEPRSGQPTLVYTNPSKMQVHGLCSRYGGLRGMAKDQVYVWSAHDMVHADAIDKVREIIDPSFHLDLYDMENMFYVGPADLSCLNSEGRAGDPRVDVGCEWAMNEPWHVYADTVVYAETYDILKTIPAFMRMVRQNGQNERS